MYLCFRTVGESTDEDEDEDDEGQTEKSTMKTSVEAAGHLIIEDKLSVIDNLVMLFVSVIVGKPVFQLGFESGGVRVHQGGLFVPKVGQPFRK